MCVCVCVCLQIIKHSHLPSVSLSLCVCVRVCVLYTDIQTPTFPLTPSLSLSHFFPADIFGPLLMTVFSFLPTIFHLLLSHFICLLCPLFSPRGNRDGLDKNEVIYCLLFHLILLSFYWLGYAVRRPGSMS